MKSHNIFHYILTFIFLFLKNLISGIVWVIIGAAGFLLFQTHKSPYDLIVGLPLTLLSLGLFLNSVHTAFLALFSPSYNRGVCPFCSKA